MDVKLSDNLRRLICRAGFLLLCLLPTVLIVRSILFPVTVSDWSSRIRQHLGVEVRIGEVVTRTPQLTEFQQLVVGGANFTTRVDIDSAVLKNVPGGRVVQMTAVSGSPAAVCRVLQRIDQQLAFGKHSDRPLQVLIDRVILRRSAEAGSVCCELHKLDLTVQRPGDHWQVKFQCHSNSENTASCSIRRTADNEQTSWQIDCPRPGIPAWVVKEFCPALDLKLGDTRIAGQATLFDRSSGWSGQITDLTMTDADLDQLVGQRFGQQLTGQANIRIEEATVVENRLLKIRGDLDCRAGTVGANLLHACQEFAAMKIVEPWPGRDVEFGQLRFGFRINHFQLTLFAPADNDAMLLAIDGSKVLIPRSGQPLSISSLLAVLAGSRNHFVPINGHTAGLASRLAWPVAPVGLEHRFPVQQLADEPLQQVGEGIFR